MFDFIYFKMILNNINNENIKIKPILQDSEVDIVIKRKKFSC